MDSLPHQSFQMLLGILKWGRKTLSSLFKITFWPVICYRLKYVSCIWTLIHPHCIIWWHFHFEWSQNLFCQFLIFFYLWFCICFSTLSIRITIFSTTARDRLKNRPGSQRMSKGCSICSWNSKENMTLVGEKKGWFSEHPFVSGSKY